jgi:hypothetical protein
MQTNRRFPALACCLHNVVNAMLGIGRCRALAAGELKRSEG